MSDFNIDFSCIDEYQKRLEELGKKASRVENKALTEGAKIIHEEILRNAPVKTGHSKKNLKLGKPKKEKGIKSIKIGVSKDDNSEAFYLKFYEYGTSKQIARPFMRPAFERKKKLAFDKTLSVVRGVFKK